MKRYMIFACLLLVSCSQMPKTVFVEKHNTRLVDEEGVTLATRIQNVGIKYPEDEFRGGIEGYVAIRFDISVEGVADNVAVISARPEGIFEQSVMEMIHSSKWLPAEFEGRAIRTNNVHKLLRFCVEGTHRIPKEGPDPICTRAKEKADIMERLGMKDTKRLHVKSDERT